MNKVYGVFEAKPVAAEKLKFKSFALVLPVSAPVIATRSEMVPSSMLNVPPLAALSASSVSVPGDRPGAIVVVFAPVMTRPVTEPMPLNVCADPRVKVMAETSSVAPTVVSEMLGVFAIEPPVPSARVPWFTVVVPE